MRRLTWLILLLVLLWLIPGCGKGKEIAAPKEGMKHEAKAATTETAKKPSEMEMEMKGWTRAPFRSSRPRWAGWRA